ncbi:carboxypeptidase-like regulatory domain-containing protein [candidate division KSB1 bacterium]|nr:carboxypeptidase-like regulatory domain-containing protein [candidate division KSB1 bacterium]
MLNKTLLFLMMVLVPAALFAGVTGKLAGKVVDQENGSPLPGANVQVVGTTMGAATDINGEFFILNVPLGTYEMKASMMGYQPMIIQGLKVTVDHTTSANFPLSTTVVELGEAVTVTADREIIQKDMTMSRQVVSGNEIFEAPVASFEAAAQLSVGAVADHFRGGRGNETLTMVDGMSIKDPFGAYFGGAVGSNSGMGINLDVPEYAIEEMEVLTGGFNAEYGNAQSGVLNLVTKVGGPTHSGTLRISADAPEAMNSVTSKQWFREKDLNLYLVPDYTDANGVTHRGSRLANLSAADISGLSESELRQLLMNTYGSDKVGAYEGQAAEFSLSGPVPFADKILPGNVTYSFNGDYQNQPQRLYEFDRERENGSFQGKLLFKISPNYQLMVSGIGSFQNDRSATFDETSGHGGKFPGGYYPGLGTMYSYKDVQRYRQFRNMMGQLKWTHTLSANSFYEVSAGVRRNAFTNRTKDYNDRDADGNTDEFLKWGYRNAPVDPSDPNTAWQEQLLYYTDDMNWVWVPADANVIVDNKPWPGGWKWGVKGKSQWKEISYVPRGGDEWLSEWRYITGSNNELELTPYPITTLNESDVYRIPNQSWRVFGDNGGYTDMVSDVYSLRGDYVNQVTARHLLKTGFQFEYSQLSQFNTGFFSTSNFYLDDWEQDPFDFAVYAQDKIEMQGMIVNAGIRFDYYDPNGFQGAKLRYPGDVTNPVDRSQEPGSDGYILNPKTAGAYSQISPRLGISHPITENDVLHFTYGHFFQRPEYRYIFENLSYDFEGAYEEMGNPELEPEKTISYEVGVEHRFGIDYVIDVTGFYKDVQNLVTQIQAGTAPFTDFWLYANADYANVRGFEITFKKMYSKYFSGQVNYTYMEAKGRASDPQDGGTFLWRKQLMPKRDEYLDFDQRHTLNVSLNVRLPETWGPTIAGYHPFGDWSLNILSSYGSGLPYTSSTRTVVPPVNDMRLPYTMQTDLKFHKYFAVWNNVKTFLFLEGYNIFNRLNLVTMSSEGGTTDDYAEYYDRFGTTGGQFQDWSVWGTRRHFKLGFGMEF